MELFRAMPAPSSATKNASTSNTCNQKLCSKKYLQPLFNAAEVPVYKVLSVHAANILKQKLGQA